MIELKSSRKRGRLRKQSLPVYFAFGFDFSPGTFSSRYMDLQLDSEPNLDEDEGYVFLCMTARYLSPGKIFCTLGRGFAEV